MNIQKMMQQAQAMQTKMQEELAAMKVEATAGGGMVMIKMSGAKEIQAVQKKTASLLGGMLPGMR